MPGAGGLHAGHVQHRVQHHPRLDRGYAWDLGEPLAQRPRRAFERAKDICHAVGLVISITRAFEREDQTACHDHHRQTAGHDETHRQHLPLHAPEIAQQFQIERGEHDKGEVGLGKSHSLSGTAGAGADLNSACVAGGAEHGLRWDGGRIRQLFEGKVASADSVAFWQLDEDALETALETLPS